MVVIVSEPGVNKCPHQADHCVWALGPAGNMIISHVARGLCNKSITTERCVLFSAIQQGVKKFTSLSQKNKYDTSSFQLRWQVAAIKLQLLLLNSAVFIAG